uniref:Uncharacterized protein n=1 Tax=Romanomermis culicivorax TaxID=13658 RepID=A0A915IYJ8_ROMCU
MVVQKLKYKNGSTKIRNYPRVCQFFEEACKYEVERVTWTIEKRLTVAQIGMCALGLLSHY